MTKWILLIYVLGGGTPFSVDVERVASFQSEEACELAAAKIEEAFDPRTTTKVRWVCIQGE